MQKIESQMEITQKLRMLQLISSCIIFSAIFLGSLPHIGLIFPSSENNLKDMPLKEIFYFLAASSIVLGTVLKKIILKAGSSGNKTSEDKEFSTYFTATVISLAFYESVAIFGFALFILTADKESSMLLTFISVAAIILGWPKLEQLKNHSRS